jgi:hypothetical protein
MVNQNPRPLGIPSRFKSEKKCSRKFIVEQQQEINAMQLALGQPLSPDAPAQTQVTSSQPSSAMPDHAATPHDGMSTMRMK